MTPPIFGLTLTHPWPLCIQQLGKPVENRTWHPTKWGGCVGMYLAIHGGKPPSKLDGASEKALDFRRDLRWMILNIINKGHLPESFTDEQYEALSTTENGQTHIKLAPCVVPGIVAVCRVSKVVRGHPSPWADRDQYNWVLSDVMPIEPIPYVGGRGLWKIEEYTVQVLRDLWAEKHDGQVMF